MNWQILNQFVEIKSPWLTLIGETILTENKQILDYWRVKKTDSLIIIVIQNNYLILPQPIYRHGLGETTLDFAGGRIEADANIEEIILNILKRELNIQESEMPKIQPINQKPWAINSSFSNQKLIGYVAEIAPETKLKSCQRFPLEERGIERLLQELTCLQCRSLLLEYLRGINL